MLTMSIGRIVLGALVITVGWGCNLFVGDFQATAGAGGAGGAGAGAFGGEGGGGGALPDALTEQGLIVRYYLDEAADGQGPNTARDAAPEPLLPLDIQYSDASPYYVTEDGHRGLRFEALGSQGKVITAINDVKVDVALEGQTEATMELVTQVEEAEATNGSRLLWLGTNNEAGRLSLSARTTNELHFRWQLDSQEVGLWTADLTERAVLHVVLDTTRNVSRERVRLFRDGVEITNTSNEVPEQGEVIALGADKFLALGNSEAGSRNLVGNIYYAALYDRALTSPEIAIHTAILSESDDTPP